jgi:hypothetical protein
MKNLNRIIAAYSKMDQRRREQTLRHLERLAREHPDRRLLRLAASNGRIQDFGQVVRITE